MKTALTVILFDREHNLRTWCAAWSLVKNRYSEYEFRVVHNQTADAALNARFKSMTENAGGVYIPRENRGYDIGALQDIARRRLPGFADYDFLLWCVDDLLPVRADFIDAYINARKSPSDLPMFELSLNPVRHVRTTGIFMPREMVEKLQFVADPIETKEHCYKFEHRDRMNHFLLQIERAGYIAKQIAPIVNSPFWDTGRSGNYLTPRKKDFRALWPEVYEARYGLSGGTVEIFATAYESYPVVAHSLIAQTYKNWRLIVEYDGEPPKDYEKFLPNDSRIIFRHSKEREQNFGHAKRARFVNTLAQSDATFIVITNHDNYYGPAFLAEAVSALDDDENMCAAYTDCVHSYIKHKVLPAKTERGFLDCGAVLFRRAEIVGVAWQSMEHSADWFWFDAIAKNRGGFRRWKKIEGVHFVHN